MSLTRVLAALKRLGMQLPTALRSQLAQDLAEVGMRFERFLRQH